MKTLQLSTEHAEFRKLFSSVSYVGDEEADTDNAELLVLHLRELRLSLPVLDRTLENCSTRGSASFATTANLVAVLQEVQNHYRIVVSLGSFIRQAISIRESWMRKVCARGRPCVPPEHWARNLLTHPPSDEEFPDDVAENFNEGQPWFDVFDGLSAA